MFFILSKILAFLLSPLFWIMVGLLWAILTKKQNRRKWLLVTVFIVFYFFSNHFLFNEVVRKWEKPGQKIETNSVYDVGIVLGGFSSYDTISNKLFLNNSGDRIWQALYLYKTGKVKKLLISGGTGSLLHKRITEADKVYEYLLKIGIPRQDLLVESKSKNTRENAVESAKLINVTHPNANCLLITSAFHMKRAMGCFSKVHLDVSPYSTDFFGKRRVWDPDKLLLPSSESLTGWSTLIREIVGYYTYKMAGYI